MAAARLFVFGALGAAVLCLAVIAWPDLKRAAAGVRRLVHVVLRLDAARLSLAQAGLHSVPVPAWIGGRLGVALFAGLVAWFWFGFPVLGLIGFAVVYHLLGVGLEVRRRRAEARRQEAVLEAIRYGVAVMSRAGNATQMLEALAESGPWQAREIFKQVIAAGGYGPGGVAFTDTLERVREEIADPLFDDFCLALFLHWKQGGKLVPALEALIADWSETLRLQREAKAMRAGVEASVILLAVLPFVFLVTVQLLGPALLAPLRTPAGEVVFALAVAWMSLGYGVLQRMSEPPREERLRLREATG